MKSSASAVSTRPDSVVRGPVTVTFDGAVVVMKLCCCEAAVRSIRSLYNTIYWRVFPTEEPSLPHALNSPTPADNRRMEMQRHRLTRYLAVVASLALAAVAPALARAQGFGLNEIGSCALARGFSATSAPCNDASVIFWNPGAAASVKGNSILAGV